MNWNFTLNSAKSWIYERNKIKPWQPVSSWLRWILLLNLCTSEIQDPSHSHSSFPLFLLRRSPTKRLCLSHRILCSDTIIFPLSTWSFNSKRIFDYLQYNYDISSPKSNSAFFLVLKKYSISSTSAFHHHSNFFIISVTGLKMKSVFLSDSLPKTFLLSKLSWLIFFYPSYLSLRLIFPVFFSITDDLFFICSSSFQNNSSRKILAESERFCTSWTREVLIETVYVYSSSRRMISDYFLTGARLLSERSKRVFRIAEKWKYSFRPL